MRNGPKVGRLWVGDPRAVPGRAAFSLLGVPCNRVAGGRRLAAVFSFAVEVRQREVTTASSVRLCGAVCGKRECAAEVGTSLESESIEQESRWVVKPRRAVDSGR